MRTTILLITILFTTAAFSQQNLTLNQAIQKALSNNYQIQIAKKNLEIAKNNNTYGVLMPNITAGVNWNNRYDDDGQVAAATNRATIPTVNMRWAVFNGFQAIITKKKFETLEEVSDLSAQMEIENTIQDIIMAYYNCLLQNEMLVIVNDIRNLSKDRYEYMLMKKDFGSAATYDVLQAKNSFLSDSSTHLSQTIMYENAIRNLNLLLGENAENKYTLIEKFTFTPQSYILSVLQEQMLSSNKGIETQRLMLKNNEREVQLKKAAYLPTLSLNSGYDNFKTKITPDGGVVTNSSSYDYYANLSLSLTIFNGTLRNIAYQNSKIQQEIGQLQIDETKLQLTNYLSTVYGQYELKKQLYNVAEESLKSAELNLEISTEKFKAGAINSFNYRDVQLIYLNSAFQKLQSIYNMIDSNTEILRLTGKLFYQE